MTNKTDFYTTAHVFVAAIRVLEYQKQAPPALDAVCDLIAISLEQGHYIIGQLKEMGIIELVSGTYGDRLFIKNHLALEEIPQNQQGSQLEDALKEFKQSREGFTQKITDLKTKQAKKKKDLFAELEMKLKKGLEK